MEAAALVDEMPFEVECNGSNRSMVVPVVNQRIRIMQMHRRQSSKVFLSGKFASRHF
jgi:hypothetical protein